MEATLDKFGRIVIPKQVRDDLGLSPGAVLRVEEAGEGIVLKPVPGQSSLIVEDGVLVFTGEVAGDLERVVQWDREERAKKLADLG
jgi:AbrB family looped-hinge helix DNA binding protein